MTNFCVIFFCIFHFLLKKIFFDEKEGNNQFLKVKHDMNFFWWICIFSLRLERLFIEIVSEKKKLQKKKVRKVTRYQSFQVLKLEAIFTKWKSGIFWKRKEIFGRILLVCKPEAVDVENSHRVLRRRKKTSTFRVERNHSMGFSSVLNRCCLYQYWKCSGQICFRAIAKFIYIYI